MTQDNASEVLHIFVSDIEQSCKDHNLSIEHGEDGTLQLVKYYNDESGEFCKVSTQLNIVPF